MQRENKLRLIAGTFVFLSAILGYFHSKYWLLFTMFVGLNLFQFAFTDWCLMNSLLDKLDSYKKSKNRGV